MPAADWSCLTSYRQVLQVLDDPSPLKVDQALAILCARDALQATLADQPFISADRLHTLHILDAKLKKHGRRLDLVLDLAAYRDSLPTPPKGWWWRLDIDFPPHVLDRYDWVFKGLTFGSWTVSIALLVNIASRFFIGGPDVAGAVAVILPSLFALLKAKSDLTQAGQQGFDELLRRFKIPAFLHVEVKFASTLVFLIALIVFWQKLPRISAFYTHFGLKHYRADQLSSAERNYLRAISLDADNGEAHYNLGRLYEDWLRFKDAKQAYQVAVTGDIPRAHNNLARLYIREENYSEAVSLLVKGKQLVEEQLTLPKEFRSIYPEDQYNLLKNLGWVRFKQERDQQATDLLTEAISISSNPNVKNLQNRASAHCILAQVYERQKEAVNATVQWKLCSDLGDSTVPEEDTWLNLANQYLQNAHKQDPMP